jgi:hypothetical protein
MAAEGLSGSKFCLVSEYSNTSVSGEPGADYPPRPREESDLAPRPIPQGRRPLLNADGYDRSVRGTAA